MSRVWSSFATASAFVSTIALSAGTQFTAWKYGYQDTLGRWFIEYSDARIYPPWSIVVWALKWWHLMPVKLGMYVALALVGFVAWAAHKNGALPWQRQKDAVVDAPEWGTEKDLRERGLLSSEPDGVVLGMLEDGRLVTYRGDEPVLFDGGTGVGKTSAGTIPSIQCSISNSMIILDPKGEQWDMTARWRSSLGPTAYFDPTDADTIRINPFSTVRFGTSFEVRDISNLIGIAIRGTGIRADDATADYYQRRTKPLLEAMALYMHHDLGRPVTLGGLLEMVPDVIDRHAAGMMKSRVKRVREAAKNFDRYATSTKTGTLEGIEDALAVFADEAVCNATSESDFDINDLMAGGKPMTLYLRSRFSDQDRLRPLMLLLNRYIISKLLYAERECDDGRPKVRSLDLILEEIGDARDEWIISRQIVIRSSGMRLVMAAQSMKLLKKVYGTLNTIDENCFAIVRYANIGQDEQAVISGDSGQRSEIVERVSRKHGPFFKDHDKTVSTASHKTPLLSRADVRGLPDDRQMVTVKGCKHPFLLHKPIWYKHPILSERGDNVRAGATRPGQMGWVLDAHKRRQRANSVVTPTPSLPPRNVFKVIGERTGWDAAEIAEKVFGGEVKATYVEQLIAGTKHSRKQKMAAEVWLDKYEREVA